MNKMHTNATETEAVSKTDDGEFSFMEFLIVLAKQLMHIIVYKGLTLHTPYIIQTKK